MAIIKLIYDNQMYIHIIHHSQQLTFQFLHQLVPKVFTKFPLKYTFQQHSSTNITQIKQKSNIHQMISKFNLKNRSCKHQNSTLQIQIFQVDQSQPQQKNQQQIIAQKLSQLCIQQTIKSKEQNKQILCYNNCIQIIKQNEKKSKSSVYQISDAKINKKENDNKNKVQILQHRQQDQLTLQLSKMKIIQGSYSEQQQDICYQYDSNQIEQWIKITKNFDQNKNKHNIEVNLVDKQKQKNQKNKIQYKKNIHYNVKCVKCKKQHIQGVRWKCIDCFNYNLCSKCQQTIQHEHDLIKIKKPKQKNTIHLDQSNQQKSKDYINLQFPGKSKHQKKQQKAQMYSEKQQKIMENELIWGQVVAKALQLQDLLEITYEQSLQFGKQHYEQDFVEWVDIYFQKKNKNVHVND